MGAVMLVRKALWLCLLCCFAVAALAENLVSLEATLIQASDRQSAQDARLDFIEYQLRRMFRFEYYRYLGSARASVGLPGTVLLELGNEHRIRAVLTDGGRGRVRASVQWLRGDDVLLNTTVLMNRAAPVVLGGVGHEDGTAIVVLVAR